MPPPKSHMKSMNNPLTKMGSPKQTIIKAETIKVKKKSKLRDPLSLSGAFQSNQKREIF